MASGRARTWVVLVGLGVLAGLALALRLMVGGEGFGLPSGPSSDTVWELRSTRAVGGVLVGATLGVAGVLLQALLRNPLASPDLMGLSSGAGLAVMVSTFLAYKVSGELSPMVATAVPAMVGAFAVLGLVYGLSQKRGLIDPVTMVLVGVVISIICGSATVLVQNLLPDRGMSSARWFMGRLGDDYGWGELAIAGGISGVVLVWAAWLGRAMDTASVSPDEARSLGVELGRLRAFEFVGAGVLTALSVVLAGPIGFVGLVCPHAVRLLAGPGHRVVVIGSALAGVVVVVGADAAIKALPMDIGRLPLGVVTSVIGGPVFLGLLMKGRGR